MFPNSSINKDSILEWISSNPFPILKFSDSIFLKILFRVLIIFVDSSSVKIFILHSILA